MQQHNSKWKRIGSGILAVCLVVSLLLSNQSFGVFAEEDGTVDAQGQESQVEESNGTEENTEEEQKSSGEVNEPGTVDEGEVEGKKENIQKSEPSKTEENDGSYAEDPEEENESAWSSENSILGENENAITMQSADVAERIVFDLSRGNVTFTDDNYEGVDLVGNSVTGTHNSNAEYVITQSDPNTATSHVISVGTEENAVTKQFNIYLSGINICVTGKEGCPIYVNPAENGKVYLILEDGTDNIAEINYADGSNVHAAVEKALDSSGLLCITCEEGYKNYLNDPSTGHVCQNDGNCGRLSAYANKTKQWKSNGSYYAGAGIGSKGYVDGGKVDQNTGKITVSKWLENITVAGGVISAYGAAGDAGSSGGGAGIGTGSCYNSTDTGAGLRDFYITGGYITAIGGDDSASCIGGGYRSNEINVTIYNGTVIANDRITTANRVRGTGIGAGGGGTQSGSPSVATVKIYDGTITASSQYGAAIGGAGSGNGTGIYAEERAGSQPAYVYIYGGNIQATSTGNGAAIGTGGPYGDTTTGQAGDATVEITGGTVTARSESGADIGGGGVTSNSDSSNGGNAKITISGGTITAPKGGIGGGRAVGGTGGNAKIQVKGGIAVTSSIGGGNSTSNNGGNAEVNVLDGNLTVDGTIGGGNSESGQAGDASIYVSGGTLDCASIGGGNSASGMPGSVTASENGGQTAGVVVAGGTLKTGTIGGGTNEKGKIGFATADISGGTIQGQFILANTDTEKQCFFHMTGGTIDNTYLGTDKYLKAQANGGAVYLSDPNGEVVISSGTIQNATAELGGAIYMTNGEFMLSGDAIIQKCAANGVSNNNILAQGGAVYLANGTVTMNGGCILSSQAAQGGAVYLNDGTVTVSNGTIGKEDSPNSATVGAGVYVAGGTLVVNGGSIMYNTATNGAGAYLQSGNMKISDGQILHNTSSENGAGAYLAGGTLEVSKGIITENTANNDGGGVYLNGGNMTLSGGRIYSNSAANGAGAYLNGGNLNVSGNGDFDSNTASADGGGAYLAGGALKVESGSFNKNTATNNGGGAYLAGGTLTISGGIFDNNTSMNGGGAYAADGAIRMFGGNITNNRATKDGGGFYVSSDQNAADVVIRSGKITGNTSGGSGAGIAVVGGENPKEDKIILGVLETHTDLTTTGTDRTFTPFSYTDELDSTEHTHASCPVLANNTATGDGGGIYMQSPQAILNIYCLEESGNISTENANGNGVMMAGGQLVIGDQIKNDENARGNTVIQSPMLVEGGQVDIWGSMSNPLFEKNILVDIQSGAGRFEDHRTQATDKIRYKIHYFENFTAGGTQSASGIYIADQYDEDANIPAVGTIFAHEGWHILGWANETDKDKGAITYKIGTSIGSSGKHEAWGNESAKALVLYAIWEKNTYTVKFYPNANQHSGSMANQTFSYAVEQRLRDNAYAVTGKRFVGWNTKADGTGMAYAADYRESKMTLDNEATVDLYAQWVDCTHKDGDHPGTLTYTADVTNHRITETCDCGGHTATIQLNAQDAYHDGKPHVAEKTISGTLMAANPTIQYKRSNTEDGLYTELTGGAEPTEIGYYEASITVKDHTVAVRYQIKSAAESVQIDGSCIDGQRFGAFQGTETCSAPQDDAFTVQYTIQKLSNVYATAPSLVFSQELPTGTTIIMQTNGTYWYHNNPTGTSISLDTFKKMGTGEAFTYSFSETQEYRFVFDFSKVTGSMLSNSLKVTLAYAHSDTTSTDAVEKSVTITMESKGTFSLTGTSEKMQITAPENKEFSRWSHKNLVLQVTAKDGEEFPADARLIIKDSDKTYTYRKNVNGNFTIPLTWEQNSNVSMSLESDLESQKGQRYAATVKLCTENAIENSSEQPQAADDVTEVQITELSLTVAATKEPSLKIDGTQKILKRTDQLKLTITTQDASDCTIHATIQKKGANGYSGNFLDAEVENGENTFSLGGITEAGSYQLLITVTRENQKLLTVPYYFIVQE